MSTCHFGDRRAEVSEERSLLAAESDGYNEFGMGTLCSVAGDQDDRIALGLSYLCQVGQHGLVAPGHEGHGGIGNECSCPERPQGSRDGSRSHRVVLQWGEDAVKVGGKQDALALSS